MVPGASVVLVWVVADEYQQVVVRCPYDLVTDQRSGG